MQEQIEQEEQNRTIQSGVWQYGTALIMLRGISLPDRCVKCNQPANGVKLQRKLVCFRTPSLFLFLLSIPIYLLTMLVTRKAVKTEVGLCNAHLSKRRTATLMSLILAVLGFLGVAIGIMITSASRALESGLFGFGGAAILFGTYIYYTLSTRIVYATGINEENIWLEGADESYLSALPRWPGAPKY